VQLDLIGAVNIKMVILRSDQALGQTAANMVHIPLRHTPLDTANTGDEVLWRQADLRKPEFSGKILGGGVPGGKGEGRDVRGVGNPTVRSGTGVGESQGVGLATTPLP